MLNSYIRASVKSKKQMYFLIGLRKLLYKIANGFKTRILDL